MVLLKLFFFLVCVENVYLLTKKDMYPVERQTVTLSENLKGVMNYDYVLFNLTVCIKFISIIGVTINLVFPPIFRCYALKQNNELNIVAFN